VSDVDSRDDGGNGGGGQGDGKCPGGGGGGNDNGGEDDAEFETSDESDFAAFEGGDGKLKAGVVEVGGDGPGNQSPPVPLPPFPAITPNPPKVAPPSTVTSKQTSPPTVTEQATAARTSSDSTSSTVQNTVITSSAASRTTTSFTPNSPTYFTHFTTTPSSTAPPTPTSFIPQGALSNSARAGAVASATIGTVALISLIVVIVWFVRRMRKSQRAASSEFSILADGARPIFRVDARNVSLDHTAVSFPFRSRFSVSTGKSHSGEGPPDIVFRDSSAGYAYAI
jgi:hypothetical protein